MYTTRLCWSYRWGYTREENHAVKGYIIQLCYRFKKWTDISHWRKGSRVFKVSNIFISSNKQVRPWIETIKKMSIKLLIFSFQQLLICVLGLIEMVLLSTHNNGLVEK